MQCGIACLQMICANDGIYFSSTEMEKICPITSDGVSLLALNNAAHKIGYETQCGRLSIINLKKIKSPCILHWNQCHFVVLYKVVQNKKKHYF